MLPRWHVKDPGHSANSAGGRLHLNGHIPLTLVRALCGNLSGNELTCDLSGNIQPHSFQLAEPLWTDSGIKSGISVLELISNHTHTPKAQAGSDGPIFSQNPRKRGKKHHHHQFLLSVSGSFNLIFGNTLPTYSAV